jgi:tape measure domain-containing protein
MAGEYGDLSARIVLDLASLKADVTKVVSMIDGMAKQTTNALGKATNQTTGLNKGLKTTSSNLWNVYTNFKDIGRVAEGILLSKLVYQGFLIPLQQSVQALWDFNNLLETTKVSLKYFLDDSKNINAFTYAMENLAAKTPYTFQQVVESSRMFLRYGFKESQILPMVKLIADMGAATGITAQEINDLTRAFGQVMAKGKLYSEEAIRQIGQVLPITEILREKLGVNIRDLKTLDISAATALNAIFEWVNENYAGAAQEVENTTKGILSSIHDFLLFIAQDIMSGGFEYFKEFLKNLRDSLESAREALREGGFKGLLLEILPENFALSIYQGIVAIKDMVRALSNMWRVSGTLWQELARLSMIIINGLVTAMAVGTRILEAFTVSAGQAIPVVRILAATIIGFITAYSSAKAILTLVSVFVQLFSVAGSVVGVLTIVLGLLTALALAIPGVQRWFTNLGQKIATLFGIRIPQSISITKAALAGMDTSQYTTDFSQIAEGFEDTGDAAAEAGKKINDLFLASFDEVYQVKEEAASVGAGAGLLDLGDLENIEMPDLGAIPDAIADADASLYKFNFTLAEFRELMKEVFEHGWNQIKLFFGAIGDSLMAIGPKILPTLLSLIGPIITTITTLITTIISTLAVLTPRIVSSLIFIISGIIIHITDVINTILSVLQANFPLIIKYIDSLLGLLLVNIAGLLAQLAIIAANGIVDMFMYMGSSFHAGMGLFKIWFNTINNIIQINITEIFHLMNVRTGIGFQMIFDSIKQSFGIMGKSIGDQFRLTLSLLSGKISFSEFKTQLMNNFNTNIADAATSIESKYSDKLTTALTNSQNRIDALTKGQFLTMQEASAKLLGQMLSDISDMSKVDGAMKKAQDAVTAWTKKWSAETLPLVIEAGKELGDGLNSSITEALAGMDLEGKSNETIAGLLEIWGGVGAELSPIITGFLDATGTTWSTWWDSAGKPLWKGTGEDLNKIWAEYMTLSKEDFNKFWDDVHQIHVEYGELFNNDANKSWSEFAEANKKFGQRYVGDAQDSWSEFSAAYKKYGADPIVTEMSKLPSTGESYMMALNKVTDTQTGEMEKTVNASMLEIKTTITDTLLEAQPIVETNTKAISDSMVNQIVLAEVPIKDSISKIPIFISDQTEEVTNRSQMLAESVVEQMQRVFNETHPTIVTDIDIPKVELPNGKSWGNFTVVGDNVALAANGGVFTREQYIGISEGNKKEGVFPLNEATMAPFAQMIANFMNQQPQGTPVERNNNVGSDYVMVPINKRDLNRELYILSKHEFKRRGE